MDKPSTCTVLPECFHDEPPRLGVRSGAGLLEAVFYTEDARRRYLVAPDLLSALEAMLDYYDYDLSESGIPATPCKAARAIVAKSRGES